MQPLILTIYDTVEFKLQQSRIRLLMKRALARSERTRKGNETRRRG